jgi:hypothetical protein
MLGTAMAKNIAKNHGYQHKRAVSLGKFSEPLPSKFGISESMPSK